MAHSHSSPTQASFFLGLRSLSPTIAHNLASHHIAMASSQMARMQNMRSTLLNISTAVVGISNKSLPVMATKLTLLRTVPPSLAADCHYLVQGGSFPCMRSEYELFFTEFANTVNVVVHELSVLGPRLSDAASSSIGTAAEDVFWDLWRVLASSSQSLAAMHFACSRLWPLKQQPFSIPLYTALNTLMAWLLPMTRSPAWSAMTSRHGRANRDKELLGMLGQPCKCLSSVSMHPPHILLSLFGTLPPTFLPLLCCILSEQFGGAPLVVRRAQPPAGTITATKYAQAFFSTALCDADFPSLLYVVTNAMHNLAVADNQTGHSGRFKFLSSPAAVQMLKVALILPPKVLAGEAGLEHCCLFELRLHLERSFLTPKAREDDSLGASAGQVAMNMDASGLPVHLNPCVSPGALETDAKVLHAIGAIMAGDTRLSELCCALQVLIVRGWLAAGTQRVPVQGAALAAMSRSVVGLAKQCTLQGFALLQQASKVQPSGQRARGLHPAQQQQQQQWEKQREQQREQQEQQMQPGGQQKDYHLERAAQVQRDAVAVRETILGQADVTHIPQVQALMYHTSCFGADIADSGSGESWEGFVQKVSVSACYVWDLCRRFQLLLAMRLRMLHGL